ncbi:MAG: tRNA uridine-5-carboxymethylaminomethyl(34) synthesis GTPase MnmE [Actinobacteria bacterium]|nr:tRNA uridine-5-carboxymethylaminomethyl(34) synthesis GTPase MnmE [Actinomycetota bacterium]
MAENKKTHKEDLVYEEDTIAAISTPVGEGGIGIVRISGTRTRQIIIEINSHGGMTVLGEILELVVRQGARIAAPGEFTKRAFLNGRIDLAQAESVIDIIKAKTRMGLQVAVNQLEGRLSEIIKESRCLLLEAVANLEAAIDFPDEDIIFPGREELKHLLDGLIKKFTELLKEGKRGRILREGLKVVIVGKPNVGKSSLLNAMLGKKRAIVTSIPGTTRDLITESISINSVPVVLYDTAGIRKVSDEIEKEGISLSKKSIKDADIVLFLVDGSSLLEKEDFLISEEVKKEKTIVLVNKNDLEERINISELEKMGFENIIRISALKAEGIDKIEEGIHRIFVSSRPYGIDSVLVTNIRHQALLKNGLDLLLEAKSGLEKGCSEDFVVVPLRETGERLGEITGETISEKLLDEIFSRFCIGK